MLSETLINFIKEGKLDDKLIDIYQGKESLDKQKMRYIDGIHQFKELFPNDDDLSIFSAPGRTEVGGNHTDHQHGQVLAAAINQDAIAIAAKNDSNVVNIKSALIKGVFAGCKNRGYQIGGVDAYVTSDVLGGSGLSSSAAFETLIGCIISGHFNDMKIDAVTIAIIGQYAENYYFGKPCGLMDQMACSVGSLCHIDFAESEPKIEKIDFDLDSAGYSLCITDTKGSHADLTSDYAAVPKEMKSVAEFFGKEYLIEVSKEDVLSNIPMLREKLGDRAVLRALHFYGENTRVEKESEALINGNVNEFLKYVLVSGDSSYKLLQNIYTTHDVEHQNMSIALCISQMILGENNGVCRVHGGGFAGTIQAFVKNEKVSEYKSALDNVFGEGSCAILKIRKYGGIRVV